MPARSDGKILTVKSLSGNEILNGWRLTTVLLVLFAVGCGSNEDEIAAKLRRQKRIAKSELTIEPSDVFATTWRGRENVTILDGVHVIGSIYPSVSVVVETDQGVLLFDTNYEEDGRDFRDAMIELNVPIEDTKEIFITHAHFDRLWGINSIRKTADVSVSVGKADCAAIRDFDIEKLHVLNANSEYRSGMIKVDRELEGGETFDFGDTTVEVLSAPGHTPGSVCYLVTKGGKRILIAGDAIGSLKFGPELLPIQLATKYGGDASAFLDTIDMLMKMEPPDMLITGRPSLMTSEQPFAFEGDWAAFLSPARQSVATTLERQQRDGRDSLDGQPKQLEDGLYYLGTLQMVAVYAIKSGDELVVINAPGGEAFSTFVEDRLRGLGIERRPDAVWLTSMDPETISGLASFDPMPGVVAPNGSRRQLSAMGVVRPTVVDESFDQSLLKGLDVTARPIADRQHAGATYSLSLASKRVLLTPPVPRVVSFYRIALETGTVRRGEIFDAERTLSGLIWEKEPRDAYSGALDQLSNETPDIWLPAYPSATQSANLYDDDWDRVIADNRRVVKKMRQMREGDF